MQDLFYHDNSEIYYADEKDVCWAEMEIIMKVTREDMQLYAVTDTQWLNGRDFYEEIEKVLAC